MTHYTVAELQRADRHIVEAERHVVRQEQIVRELHASANSTEIAAELLRQFNSLLAAHCGHRAAIITALKESGQF